MEMDLVVVRNVASTRASVFSYPIHYEILLTVGQEYRCLRGFGEYLPDDETKDIATGTKPSRMKIHCQPLLPPIPSISPIANASKPEKAPAIEAIEKTIAKRC